MAEYQRIDLDLSTARDRGAVVDSGQPVETVAVHSVSAGATFDLHFGNKRGITVDSPIAWNDLCPPETDGLLVSNVAQPGASAVLYAWFSRAEVAR